jgi:protein kinase X
MQKVSRMFRRKSTHGSSSGASKSGSDDDNTEARPATIITRLIDAGVDIDAMELEDFEQLQTIGTGTFGRVYLVKHMESGLYFAMKVLKKADVVRLKQVSHLKSERAILARVQHHNVVNLVRSFQDETCLYMLLEYVMGGELFTHLRRAKRFSTDVARFYCAEVVAALEYLHAKGIVYRDLKPENLLLDSNGGLKITDFGFAKVVEDRTWTLCGTPEYLAPEIIQSKGHGKAVDWWATGILLFEMLAGYPPFYDDNPFSIYEKILEGKLVFPTHIDPHAKDLIRRLLTPDRSRRLGSLRGGAHDVMKHKFFKSIDWTDLANREIPSPLVPETRGEGDTRNFDVYDEDDEEDYNDDAAAYAGMFEDFS